MGASSLERVVLDRKGLVWAGLGCKCDRRMNVRDMILYYDTGFIPALREVGLNKLTKGPTKEFEIVSWQYWTLYPNQKRALARP